MKSSSKPKGATHKAVGAKRRAATKKAAPKKAAAGSRRRAVPKAVVISKVEIPIRGTEVEESKYFVGAVAPAVGRSGLIDLEHRELPGGYAEDVLALQVRDPWWAHAYWDLDAATYPRLKRDHAGDLEKSRWVLRSYDVSYINFDGTNAHRFFDTSVDRDARNWYLNFGAPGTSWCVDLGFILPDGRFITVLRSNVIALPLDGPSWVTDEEWMIPDDEFRRLYGMSVGLGPNVSSPVGKLWQERLKKDITSGGIASMGSPVKRPLVKLPFWMVVDCELIVYGATEPDARVTVQGKAVALRKDGTFTLRFALPDGQQVIPVVGVSAKTGETRTITPTVTRKTTRNP
jgi:hypothetical protein